MEPTHKNITVKGIPVSLWKRVRLKAISTGKSVSEFVSAALETALQKGKQ